MGDFYRVVKTIHGRRYAYWQRTKRVGGQVKTENRYIGPVSGAAAFYERAAERKVTILEPEPLPTPPKHSKGEMELYRKNLRYEMREYRKYGTVEAKSLKRAVRHYRKRSLVNRIFHYDAFQERKAIKGHRANLNWYQRKYRRALNYYIDVAKPKKE